LSSVGHKSGLLLSHYKETSSVLTLVCAPTQDKIKSKCRVCAEGY
jgi:hypothetical protein